MSRKHNSTASSGRPLPHRPAQPSSSSASYNPHVDHNWSAYLNTSISSSTQTRSTHTTASSIRASNTTAQTAASKTHSRADTSSSDTKNPYGTGTAAAGGYSLPSREFGQQRALIPINSQSQARHRSHQNPRSDSENFYNHYTSPTSVMEKTRLEEKVLPFASHIWEYMKKYYIDDLKIIREHCRIGFDQDKRKQDYFVLIPKHPDQGLGIDMFVEIHHHLDNNLVRITVMIPKGLTCEFIAEKLNERFECFPRKTVHEDLDVICLHDDKMRIDSFVRSMRPTHMSATTAPSTFQSTRYMVLDSLAVVLHQCDITSLEVDAITNAANPELNPRGGLFWIIAKAAGSRFVDECRLLMKRRRGKELGMGEVVRTSGGQMPATYVYHASGPVWPGDECSIDVQKDCICYLELTFSNIITAAMNDRIVSLAIPPISSGVYSVPLDYVAQSFMKSLKQTVSRRSSLKVIHLVDISPEFLSLADMLFKSDPSYRQISETDLKVILNPQSSSSLGNLLDKESRLNGTGSSQHTSASSSSIDPSVRPKTYPEPQINPQSSSSPGNLVKRESGMNGTGSSQQTTLKSSSIDPSVRPKTYPESQINPQSSRSPGNLVERESGMNVTGSSQQTTLKSSSTDPSVRPKTYPESQINSQFSSSLGNLVERDSRINGTGSSQQTTSKSSSIDPKTYPKSLTNVYDEDVRMLRQGYTFQPSGFLVKGNTEVFIHQCDIRHLHVDAIVNAANKYLSHVGGLADLIAKSAGKDLTDDCERITIKNGYLKESDVVKTRAGSLPCKMVFHAVGPIWPKTEDHKKQEKCLLALQKTFVNIFQLAEGECISTLACPAISTGIHGVPVDYVASTIGKVLLNGLPPSTRIREIHLVDIADVTLEAIHRVLAKNFALIDDRRTSEVINKRLCLTLPKPGSPMLDQTSMTRESVKSPHSEQESSSNMTSVKPAASKSHLDENDHQRDLAASVVTDPVDDQTKPVGFHYRDRTTIFVHVCDITQLKVDAIVNPANGSLVNAGGLAGAIDYAAGLVFRQECEQVVKRKGRLSVGGVLTMHGHLLPAKFVIHAVGPMWPSKPRYEKECLDRLQKTFDTVMKESRMKSFGSIAIPAISSGIFGVPIEKVVPIMCHSILKGLKDNPNMREVHLVDISDSTVAVIQAELFTIMSSNSGKKVLKEVKYDDVKTRIKTLKMESTISSRITPNLEWEKGGSSTLYERERLDRSREVRAEISSPISSTSRGKSDAASARDNLPAFDVEVGKRRDDEVSAATSGSSHKYQHFNPGNYGPAEKSSVVLYDSSYRRKENSSYKPDPGGTRNTPKDVTESLGRDPNTMALVSYDTGKKNTSQKTETVLPDTCAICLSDIIKPKTLAKCKHTFCETCINQYFKYNPKCPSCGERYGIEVGDQPANGKMYDTKERTSLPGYEIYGTIVIDYNFPGGIQAPDHPNPGQRYSGTSRTAYLPDSPEGQEVLALLRKAFDARLLFTIGRSVTTGADNVVTWNDIHHKTSTHGGSTGFGYPDDTYLNRVKQELASKGIK